MPLDPASLDSGTPTAKDGRTYPRRLKRFESFDEIFLPVFNETAEPIEFDDLIERVADRQARAAAASWLDSAAWRGLVSPMTRRGRRPRAWKRGPRFESSPSRAA